MILYHGSYLEIKKPDILFSRNNVDFGLGFYTTPIEEQAKNWAARFKMKKGISILNVYDFDEAMLPNDVSILRFDSYDELWLNYIISSRNGENNDSYDIVIGGVADDRVFDTIELYFDGLIDKDTAIGRLRYHKPNLQVVFRSQRIIDQYLIFLRSEVL